ncbi:helix-turn-helix domain-containing protein [Corallococcus exiguus]|uniref:helix-turn-helix domain-containing protein n=1 Tax=Corallococcus exiguus TaxID=83462 RepID=UPI00155FF2FE|nr:helix-turn-helix domain-containing protein [Corallococcus exiguus]NRD67099.1 helix-turn-helix domain-containing protein [Corallococcus exiguus]
MSEPTPPKESEPSFLTVDEAAELLRVNRKTLYEAIRLGQLPGVIRLGRCVRLSRATMLSWASGNGGPALGAKK